MADDDQAPAPPDQPDSAPDSGAAAAGLSEDEHEALARAVEQVAPMLQSGLGPLLETLGLTADKENLTDFMRERLTRQAAGAVDANEHDRLDKLRDQLRTIAGDPEAQRQFDNAKLPDLAELGGLFGGAVPGVSLPGASLPGGSPPSGTGPDEADPADGEGPDPADRPS